MASPSPSTTNSSTAGGVTASCASILLGGAFQVGEPEFRLDGSLSISCSPSDDASQMSKLGNGWCDTGAPFNTEECGYDGGDCCDTSLPLYDCQDPRSPNYQLSSATGLYFPAPVNPLYSDAAVGRSVSVSGVVQSYNNFYEVRLRDSLSWSHDTSHGRGPNCTSMFKIHFISPMSLSLLHLTAPLTVQSHGSTVQL